MNKICNCLIPISYDVNDLRDPHSDYADDSSGLLAASELCQVLIYAIQTFR